MNKSTGEKTFVYGKREANIIKGIAIILMLIHHLFTFPHWIDNENMYIGTKIMGFQLEIAIGIASKVCVALFSFTTGYALFVNDERYDTIKKCSIKEFKFLVKYWIVVIIILIIGALLKEPLPSCGNILLHCFGINTGSDEVINGGINTVFTWYVLFYSLFILMYPILRKISKKI